MGLSSFFLSVFSFERFLVVLIVSAFIAPTSMETRSSWGDCHFSSVFSAHQIDGNLSINFPVYLTRCLPRRERVHIEEKGVGAIEHLGLQLQVLHNLGSLWM